MPVILPSLSHLLLPGVGLESTRGLAVSVALTRHTASAEHVSTTGAVSGVAEQGTSLHLGPLPTLPPPECKLPEAQNCEESISGPWGSPSWVLCRAGVQNMFLEKPAEVREKDLISKYREPRKAVASFIRQRLKSLKQEREWM